MRCVEVYRHVRHQLRIGFHNDRAECRFDDSHRWMASSSFAHSFGSFFHMAHSSNKRRPYATTKPIPKGAERKERAEETGPVVQIGM